jgi:chaperonin GroES
MDTDLITLLNSVNIAETLDKDTLAKMGLKVVELYEDDKTSREDWENMHDEYIKLATQIVANKSFPWENASNIKWPLLTTAAIQFHARAYPALIANDQPVKPKVIGSDPGGEKAAKANRVSYYMSWQVMEEMEEWQEDMDRLLIILPILGSCYRKVYYSPSYGRARSELVLPHELVINYNASDFEKARKTHVIYMSQNDVFENMRRGIYLDIDLDTPSKHSKELVEDEATGTTNVAPDEDNPHIILEQHTWWDLDEDGYKEPYIITVDYDSEKVLRIVARWDKRSVELNDNNELVKITPIEYFVKYPFVPNPASRIYDLGFGSLLGPINEGINTITNQLIDAGTLANLQGGFLGKGIRIKGGVMRVAPGEWKQVPSTGDDLRKNIFPLPFKEPSSALFNLLQLLITSGEKLSSVTDIMVGESPGQNQPYATTAAVLEQGLKVFTGIYKRIYRALGKEFKALYKVNSDYVDISKYITVLDVPPDIPPEIVIQDFQIDLFDVIPAADPNYVPNTLKLAKAQSLFEKVAQGLPVNKMAAVRAVLEAEGHENIEALLQQEAPEGPPPDIQLKMEELEHRKVIETGRLELDTAAMEYESLKDVAQAIAHMARAQSMSNQAETAEFNAVTQRFKAQQDALAKRLQAITGVVTGAAKATQEPKENGSKPTTKPSKK